MSDQPVDLWIGPPPYRHVVWRGDPDFCPHGGLNACPSCADLDAYEAEAMRRFIAGEPRP